MGRKLLASRHVWHLHLPIMIEGPLGGAAFNNEFGRPALTGYFRTFEQNVNGEVKGFRKTNHHFAGGYGNIRPDRCRKRTQFSQAIY